MVGRLLAMDLQEHGVVVSIVHPGFMRTDMTRGVGFDKFWDDGGAVTPREAAESLVKWVADLREEEEKGLARSGEYWAPRGASTFSLLYFTVLCFCLGSAWRGREDGEEGSFYMKFLTCCLYKTLTLILIEDIGTAEVTMGKDLPTPLRLPW
jgi:hypothetical protein